MSSGDGPHGDSSTPSPTLGVNAPPSSLAAEASTPAAAVPDSVPASRTTSHNGGDRHTRRRGPRPGRRRKPQEFLMADGRRVLVALPEDVDALRDKYAGVMREAAQDGGEGAPQVEVVVHGSQEHKQYLEECQAHHRSQRDTLRAKYGPEMLAEWDRVTADFNNVSTELEKLADHSASLGHNFSKFGYSATLRTFGGDEGHGGGGGGGGHGGPSGSSSRRGSEVGSSADSVASGTDDDDDDDSGSGGDDGGKSGVPVWHNQNNGQIMQLFKRPIVKQYFHRGLLWRASEETSVQSFELFFDLLYVGIIAVNGDHAAESADGFELLRFLVTFCLSWKIWSDVTQLVSWFSTNDVVQRVEILFLFACLLGVTVNMVQTFYGWGSSGEAGSASTAEPAAGGSAGEHSLLFRREEPATASTSEAFLADTYPALAAYYVTARLFMGLYCFVTGLLVPLVQGTMFCQVALIVIGAALWIASIHLSMPVRLACVFVALAFDLFGGSFVVGLFRYANSHSKTRLGRYLTTKVFDFYPAMNIEHKVERTNAFISLVLGYSVVGVLYQNSHGYGVNAFLGKAVLGLVQAFIFNWIYFDIDSTNIHVHAIRRRAETAYIWQYAHLLFTLAFILSSAALTRFVVATDVDNASLDSLTEMYQARSSPELSLGLRLYYSTGLGVSLFSMTLIALCHQHKIPPTARLPKWARMANRLAVSAIFCALPAAQTLSSLSVMSIATGLIAWVLIVEIYGQSCVGDRLFETREAGDYTARCSQRRLRKALRDAERERQKDVEDGGRDQPQIDVNVLTQGQKHGAIYME
ncbi:hypothetical protein SPBR_01379 [Sporothrix brasiliensis 5110]|uniref:Uncharacterized protein n=1 Tax=Sporothrix brasiliensis 5110 TaxID=1398154 RepID=A0A0C2IXV1_9PEZI|nr:uncharacterized protein SPBR_01379 [Sporothrix brasiliensis 5110]KIH91560.1 hypothetical protein SPBR_01379 [Sporothrix brasiliensis 5110]